MRIAPAAEEHVEPIIELWDQLALIHEELDSFCARSTEATAHFRTYVHHCIEAPDATVLVCLDGERVIGYAIAMIELHPPTLRRRDYGFIDNLVVDRNERRMGAGTLLLEAVIGYLRSRGVNRIELEVAEANEEGIAFWDSQGFEVFQRALARAI